MNTASQNDLSDASDIGHGHRTNDRGSDLLRRVGHPWSFASGPKPAGHVGGQPLGEYAYRAESAEPLKPGDEWLREFEAELNQAIAEGWPDVAF